MIAFFQTGGIGDAILGSAVVRKLAEEHGDVAFLHYNHLVPQVIQGMKELSFVRKMTPEMCRDMDAVRRHAPEVDMVIFNKFRKDHRGMLNFFCPTNDSTHEIADMYRERYEKSFEEQYGRKLKDVDPLSLLRIFNLEDDYFSDWKRYGVDVDYSDVNIPIYDHMISGDRKRISSLSKYAIVHDSKMPVDGESVYPLKAWYVDRWAEVCRRLKGELGMNVVQITTGDQEPFCDEVIPHSEVIGADAVFQDYLYLLSESSLYIGTDSWPAHAAIFTRKPKYVIMKGAVSRRWDHGGKFSRIIRKGGCQSCEGPLAASNTCIWGKTERECMDLISVEDVMEGVHAELG